LSTRERLHPLGPASNRFLYRGVADILRGRVENGEYDPGSQLPTLVELATEFGVSAITVRRALRDLSLEGTLVGKQGLGIFVAERQRIVRSLSVDAIAPIENEMQASGVRPGLLDLGVTTVPATDQPFLSGLAKGNKTLVKLNRLLLANDEPVGLDVLWLTKKVADKLEDKLHGEFLMSSLEPRGFVVDRLTYQVEAMTANETQAAHLRVVSGFPLLVIRFFPMDSANKPILVGQTTTRADRFTYEFGAKLKRRK